MCVDSLRTFIPPDVMHFVRIGFLSRCLLYHAIGCHRNPLRENINLEQNTTDQIKRELIWDFCQKHLTWNMRSGARRRFAVFCPMCSCGKNPLIETALKAKRRNWVVPSAKTPTHCHHCGCLFPALRDLARLSRDLEIRPGSRGDSGQSQTIKELGLRLDSVWAYFVTGIAKHVHPHNMFTIKRCSAPFRKFYVWRTITKDSSLASAVKCRR